MGEVLKTWFRDRLGILIDLSPDEFGQTTKDGTLLAQLLHSYDIIDNAQLKTIINTEDPALARVNLKHLRLWLKFIGVECDNDTIEDISNGKGTTAARLFYKIFVSLESKDKLHFITQQKEREKYIPNSAKFDVTTIPDRPPTPEPSENPLAEQLVKNADVIVWYRNKFKKILDRCKLAREQCVAKQAQRTAVENEVAASITEKNRQIGANRVSPLIKKEMKELEDFSYKHEVSNIENYTYRDLCNEKKIGEKMEPTPVDPDAAKTFVKCVKDRSRRASEIYNCKSRMAKALTTKLWEKQMDEQEREFDSAIATKLFTQSQYEKQMITKLCEIRDQKRRVAKNRGTVEKLIRERTEAENNMELAREHEYLVKEGMDIEAECLRMCELNRRINYQRLQNAQNRHHRICTEVLNDLLDISLKAASYREANDNYIPSKIWAEWKALFVKNQQISDMIEYGESFTDSMPEEENEEIFRVEKERQEILNEADFDNYLHVTLPWAEFMPEIDLETQEILRLGNIVLGYIVHSLLYYFKSGSQPAPLPKVATACILLGVLDTSVYSTIELLLNHRNIKVLRMEDGINYCLQCYKEEMKPFAYVDLDIAGYKTEKEPIKAPSNQNPRSKNGSIVKKQESTKKTPKSATVTTHGVDEETQTPRSLPDDDMSPELSNPAYLGKWIHELFTLGQPIPNALNTKIIVEYIKSLNAVKGWVLIDYPNTFNQMALLETALTGIEIPLEKESFNDLDENITDPNSNISTISYGVMSNSSDFKESRLICNPTPKDVGQTFNSYMTAYIRALPKPKNMHAHEADMSKILPEDATSIDAFYTEHGLAHAVYYTSFDLFTLKKLCRLVIGDTLIPRIPSLELFGNTLGSLEDRKDEPPLSKAPVIKQLVPNPTLTDSDWAEESEYEGEGANSEDTVFDSANNIEPILSKPGEEGWEWIKFPQSPMLLEALATLWKNMETVYIEEMKEIFSMKRVNYSHILPYRNYVTKHMIEFIKRPDTKQDMLHAFQTEYNDIAKDMRDDLDIKCELHCRVVDFREELWEICDERRKQAEEERQRIIRQGWTAEEMVALANLYICMLEAEMDRCIDTLQLIQDYYTSMLQRPIPETRFPKYPLQKLELNPIELVASASSLSPVKVSKQAAKESSSLKGGKNMKSKSPSTSPTFDCSNLRGQIADLMITADSELFDPEKTTCYQAIKANFLYLQNIVESLASSILENLKKEQASFAPDAKGRIQMTKNFQTLPTANVALMAEVLNRGSDLCHEWRSAVQFEINRVILRLKLLNNAAQSAVSFLYETIKLCFNNILRDTNDRYNKEIKSVNDMASLFCLAIEEGISVQEELLLDGDRFIVRSNVLMYPDDPPLSEPIAEAILPSEFRMGQLGRLMDIFRYVAPHGSLPERIFTYILEDMVACGEMESGITHLPASWYKLRACDVSSLVEEIFGDSEYIDWREFIIYAMDIPMPNAEEILDMRSQFIAMDPTLTETVTRDEFHSVKLWFSNCDLKDPACKNLLHEDYQRDEEEMYEDEEDYAKIETCSGLVLPNEPSECKPSFFNKKSLTNSTFSLSSRNMTPQETVRLMLAKELLCEMFASGCNMINYTAFLLALCKAYDPREGLGKALTLALGKKVCSSEKDGEEFVARLLEQRRLTCDKEAMRNDEQKAAGRVRLYLNDLMENRVIVTII